MTRKVCSALVGVGMCFGLTALGQEPPAAKNGEAQKKPPPTVVMDFSDLTFGLVQPTPDSLEEAIARALRHHPDVRLAEARRQVADAELAQARLLVTQRVTVAHGKVAEARAQVKLREADHARTLELAKNRSAPPQTVQRVEAALATAKANLAAAEADFRAAVGATEPVAVDAVQKGVVWLTRNQAQGATDVEWGVEGWNVRTRGVPRWTPAPGSPAEKLRGLVDKTVKLDQKPLPFTNAMAEFVRAAGLADLTIRYPDWATAEFLRVPPKVPALRGEHTAVAWLQMMVDDFNRAIPETGVPEPHFGRYEAYVREYGLLITKADLAPPGAVTLGEFARQVRAEKAAAEKAKPSQGSGRK